MKLSQNSRGIIFWVFIVFSGVLIMSLIQGIWAIFEADERVENLEQKVANLKQEQSQLEEELSLRSRADFQEKEIREKLRLSREDEITLDLPDQIIEETKQANVLLERQQKIANEKEKSHKKVWQKWLELL